MKKLLSLLILTAILFLTGCKITSSGGDGTASGEALGGQVLVINEGSYMFSNASVTLYNPVTGGAVNQAFAKFNGFPIGDALQSATVAGEYLCLAVSNSGKVIICEAATLKYVATIDKLTSPRYIAYDPKTKQIYITDLYSKTITVASLETMKVVQTMDVGMTTEQILLRDGYLYACSWDAGRNVIKIDVKTMLVVATVAVALQPNSMQFDAGGRLWVLSDGGFEGMPKPTEQPAIACIDPTSLTVVKRYDLEEKNPSELCVAPNGKFYFLGGGWGAPASGIFTWDIETGLAARIIPSDGKLFYGLGIDPIRGDIYASDAIDYIQRGIVYRYSPKGDLVSSFKADIIPGGFCFL